MPEVDQIPPNFYDDGIQSLEGILKFRDSIAIKHKNTVLRVSMRESVKCYPNVNPVEIFN